MQAIEVLGKQLHVLLPHTISLLMTVMLCKHRIVITIQRDERTTSTVYR